MSQQNSTFSSSNYSYSSTSSNSNSNGEVTGSRNLHHETRDPSGTSITTASQNLGEPVLAETRQFDSSGNPMIGSSSGGASNRIQEVTDSEQAKRDQRYEEHMEDEYAKREGGA